MADLTPKRLYTGNALASNVYTVSSTAGSYTIIKTINVANTTTTDKTFNLHIIPAAGSATVSNKIMSTINVPANDVISADTIFVLEASEALYYDPTDSNLTLYVAGVEYTP